MTYDLGTRPKELLGINIGDIIFDEHGAIVTVGEYGKTGARTLRAIMSLPYLRSWVESHPYRDNKDTPLFIGLGRNQFGSRIDTQTLRRVFKQAAKQGGIDKKLWPYLLRHSSITREANKGLGDQQLKVFYGWSPDSRMLNVYSHLTSDDVNKIRLEHVGLVEPTDKHRESEFRECPRCGEINSFIAEYCQKCSSVLDESKYRVQQTKEEEIKELNEKISWIENNITTYSQLRSLDSEGGRAFLDMFAGVFSDVKNDTDLKEKISALTDAIRQISSTPHKQLTLDDEVKGKKKK